MGPSQGINRHVSASMRWPHMQVIFAGNKIKSKISPRMLFYQYTQYKLFIHASIPRYISLIYV